MHELTAIVPLIPLYFTFKHFGSSWQPAKEATEKAERILDRYPWLAERVGDVAYLGASYAVVKMLMPVRIAFCLWYTPRLVRQMSTIAKYFKR